MLTPCARLECAWLLLLSHYGHAPPDVLTPCIRLERMWLLLLSHYGHPSAGCVDPLRTSRMCVVAVAVAPWPGCADPLRTS